jgi:TonB family protein
MNASAPEMLIEKLPPAVYPPIARAARVSGQVQISLTLHPDGTIASAEVLSGPVLLRQAALEAVKQTHFECKNCSSDLTGFTLAYRFELVDGTPCSAPYDSYPRMTYAENSITVQQDVPWLCDPAGTVSKIRIRSAKCLYLWKCGQH